MDTLEQYRRIVRELIQEYAQYQPARGDVQIEVVFDESNDHYELINVEQADKLYLSSVSLPLMTRIELCIMSSTDPNLNQFQIQSTTSTITRANRWDHVLARWGVRRGEHRVAPGLYALGRPTPDSPVFVTANYTLSFDALRSALSGIDGYVLVLDTLGINVWCAAGVSAHAVKQRSGFKVEYGPVRAADLPEYLKTHQATSEMRQVRFDLRDRLVLVPVEAVHVCLPMLLAALVLYFVGGFLAAGAAVAAILAGVALFPILLPWLPTRDFSSKGFILGGLVALPFALAAFFQNPDAAWWLRAGGALAYLLAMPPVTAYLALNFTGATPFTSRSGVRREIFTYVPLMAWTLGIGVALALAFVLLHTLGGRL